MTNGPTWTDAAIGAPHAHLAVEETGSFGQHFSRSVHDLSAILTGRNGLACSKRFAGFSAIFVSMRYQHCRETPTKPSRRFGDGVGASGSLEPVSNSVSDTFGDRENSRNRPHAELP
jgi:hypothetical protein